MVDDIFSRIVDKKELELERFMTLAEDVSNKIGNLTFQKKITVASIVVSTIVCGLLIVLLYYLNQIEFLNTGGIIVTFALVFIPSFFNIFKSLQSIKKINEDIERESYILGDLLNITDSYKEKRLDHNDAARKVYFDMRMSRIDFNHAKFKKQPQNTLPLQQETTTPKPTESPVSTTV